jgi:hypothetical protein
MRGHWTPRIRTRSGEWTPTDERYVVVDEIDSTLAILLVTGWPSIDRRGRPHFRDRTIAVATAREALERLLRGREPRHLHERDLRIGDVFAMNFRAGAPFLAATPTEVEAKVEPVDLNLWVEPPVIDVTPDAREMAKVAFFAAVTPTISKPAAVQLELEIHRAREEPLS